MRVMPIRFVRDMAESERFYRLLGLQVDARQRSGGWMELAGSGGTVALHLTDGGSGEPAVELAFVADEPLETLETLRTRLADAGFESDVMDEAFGRSLRVTDPEGVRLQINEYDRDLYT